MTQEQALDLLRSDQMPIARYIQLAQENGWETIFGNVLRETKTQHYLIQENWKDTEWVPHLGFDGLSLEEARKVFQERKSDPSWHQNGRRKWRVVRRTIIDVVVEE